MVQGKRTREEADVEGDSGHSRFSGGPEGSNGNKVDWSGVDSQLLFDAVCAVTRAGAALTLGTNRKGTDYYIATIDQGERTPLYTADVTELESWLKWVTAAAAGA